MGVSSGFGVGACYTRIVMKPTVRRGKPGRRRSADSTAFAAATAAAVLPSPLAVEPWLFVQLERDAGLDRQAQLHVGPRVRLERLEAAPGQPAAPPEDEKQPAEEKQLRGWNRLRLSSSPRFAASRHEHSLGLRTTKSAVELRDADAAVQQWEAPRPGSRRATSRSVSSSDLSSNSSTKASSSDSPSALSSDSSSASPTKASSSVSHSALSSDSSSVSPTKASSVRASRSLGAKSVSHSAATGLSKQGGGGVRAPATRGRRPGSRFRLGTSGGVILRPRRVPEVVDLL